MQRIALGFISLLAVLALAAPADAGTLSKRAGAVLPGQVMAYAARAGEANLITFEAGSEIWTLRDQAPVTAEEPCGTGDGYATFDPHCPSDGLVGVEVSLGDRDDSADFSGVPGGVVVVPGAGRDTITTGARDDAVDARDGEADTIRCGAGKDTVLRDPVDSVAADCEDGAAATGTPPPATTPSGGGAPAATKPKPKVTLTVSPQRLRKVLRRGITLLARAGETPIEARIEITLARALAKRLGLGSRRVTAARRFTDLDSFQTRRLHVKLSKRVRRALKRAPKRMRMKIAATPVAADGTHGKVASLTVRVRR